MTDKQRDLVRLIEARTNVIATIIALTELTEVHGNNKYSDRVLNELTAMAQELKDIFKNEQT